MSIFYYQPSVKFICNIQKILTSTLAILTTGVQHLKYVDRHVEDNGFSNGTQSALLGLFDKPLIFQKKRLQYWRSQGGGSKKILL